jgi:hypothetical protein
MPASPHVLAELNGVLGSAPLRGAMRESLARMAPLRSMMDAALDGAGVPRALKGVPLVESQARSVHEIQTDPTRPRGAGMWMFIPPTARLFGLRVDGVLDERLDPGRETAAAARYLARLHRRFGDWGLALAAYNRGERLVEAAILESGSRDTWALVSRGLLNRYPAVVMAAGLLCENPSLVAD